MPVSAKPHHSGSALVGRQLANGRYRVIAKLAEGGMGFVYRAEDLRLGNDVVIKMPRPEMIQLSADRFMSEIRSLVQFAHPHILRIIDVGDFEGTPFAVMQFLAGGSLESHLKRVHPSQRSLPIQSLQQWLRAIAIALDFIHSQSYVHRDVKPPNILFDSFGNPFLSDFGVGKVISSIAEKQRGDAMSKPGAIVGTPQYMAPELTAGNRFDGRSDQYSLAVCVYEVLAGRKPFDGSTVVAIHIEQMGEGPTPLNELNPLVSSALADAVHKGLSYLADDRYKSCVEFADAVLAAAGITTVAPRIADTANSADAICMLPRMSVAYQSECSVDGLISAVRDNLESWNGELIRFERNEVVFHSRVSGKWFDRLLKKSQGPVIKVQLNPCALAEGTRVGISLAWPEDDLLQHDIEAHANHLLSQLIVKLRLSPTGDTRVEMSAADTTEATAILPVHVLYPSIQNNRDPVPENQSQTDPFEEQLYAELLDENEPAVQPEMEQNWQSTEEVESLPTNLKDLCKTLARRIPGLQASMFLRRQPSRITAKAASVESGFGRDHLVAFAEYALDLANDTAGPSATFQQTFIRVAGINLFVQSVDERDLFVAVTSSNVDNRQINEAISPFRSLMCGLCDG